MSECIKKNIITIIIVSLVVIVFAVVITVVDLTTKSGEEEEGIEKKGSLTILQKDHQFQKSNIKMNAEFELVKMENGMTGMLISDPYASQFHIIFVIKYGTAIDTVSGLSHFGEHMVLQNCQKYNFLYPYFKFLGIKDSSVGAQTYANFQNYFIFLPFNMLYKNAMDVLTELFRYPLYSPEIVKNEIQAVNHEFYTGLDKNIESDIIIQLSNQEPIHNEILCGNSQTLKPEESEFLSRKLKGYHMRIKSPDKIFFTLYSNMTIKEEEELAKKYLNYKMHVFPDDEIDVQDLKKLEDNIYDIENKEIYDDNLYKHGIYINTNTYVNILKIYYYIGNLKTKELGFLIFEYYIYLFNSESLLKILRDKNYIIAYSNLEIAGDYSLDNNSYLNIEMTLTEEGLKEINDILLIINKYITILKSEGYKQKYFDDFIKYMNNQDILSFNKNDFFGQSTYLQMYYNYLHFAYDNILLSGKYTYNEQLLKEVLNLLRYEKSFYTVNTKEKLADLNLDGILTERKIKTPKFYKSNYLIGLIPQNLENKIKDNSKIEKLKIRDTSPYFSANYNDAVIPCYKEIENKCKEKNEFDVNKDDKYNGTILDENDKNYVTIYQIDKSSESHLVYSYLKFTLDEPDVDDETYTGFLLMIEEDYLEYIMSEIKEIPETVSIKLVPEKMTLTFIIQAFSDNTEIIIKRLIDLLTESPKEENFNYTKLLTTTKNKQSQSISFAQYIFTIFEQIATNQDYDLDMLISLLNGFISSMNYDGFKAFHDSLLQNTNKIDFIIAGNINKELVEKIHNYIKSKIKIEKRRYLSTPTEEDNDSPFVKNYYQKSTMNDPQNGIIVAYEFPSDLKLYFSLFADCFQNIAYRYLRFYYTNVYTPYVLVRNNYFIILEGGLYKEVDQMEDDINKVLYDTIINKNNDPLNYKEILESYISKEKAKEEKNLYNLFNKFVSDNIEEEVEEEEELNIEGLKIPKDFSELIDIISDCFTNPKRYSILIARNDLSDADFDSMYKKRKQKINYSLNSSIIITHTNNITEMINLYN